MFCLFFIALRGECAERQPNASLKTKESEIPDHRDEDIDLPQIYYYKNLLRCAEAVEPVPMQKSWIENILKVSTFTYNKPHFFGQI